MWAFGLLGWYYLFTKSSSAPHTGKNARMQVQTQRLLTPWVRGFGRMGTSDPCSRHDLTGLHTCALVAEQTLHENVLAHTNTHTFLWGSVRCPFPLRHDPSAVWLHALLAQLCCPGLLSNLIFSFYPLFIIFFFSSNFYILKSNSFDCVEQ